MYFLLEIILLWTYLHVCFVYMHKQITVEMVIIMQGLFIAEKRTPSDRSPNNTCLHF